ncbi:PREDICTED: acyltransferase-like protein At3g26840, chloroplastic [Populus euphratica]|uniref:Acyltransferase-like protein At3g26840, chloroplastic n=1 Tax=Populus euphratica TaxID=75702 RepID=A0AAJ6VDG6_POPEU|nr:PREDICTED: acyltransferase-like protein At3g26840, chloroplastic [Populus euphratica]
MSMVTGGCLFTVVHCCVMPSSLSSTSKLKLQPTPTPTLRFAVSGQMSAETTPSKTETTTTNLSGNGRFKKKREEEAETEGKKEKQNPYVLEIEKKEIEFKSSRKGLDAYFEGCRNFIKSDGGPPRWFSPLECGSRLDNSPLLLFLPGIDGVGLGLCKHHHTLGRIFDIWCLHIPVKDRTPFLGLVKLVERTVRSENYHSPKRPIYLVGESLGACLALAVAARNPDINLSLVLSNPATSFEESPLQPLISFLEIIPVEHQLSLSYVLSLMTGDSLRIVMDNAVKGIPLHQIIGGLSKDVIAMSSHLNDLAALLPRETLLWKLQMLRPASEFANSRLAAVKAQTLVLSSGKDQFLPSEEEGQRLFRALPKCENRKFNDSGHFLFLEDGIDLATIIKGSAAFYRRGMYHDYVSDYVPPTPSELKILYESNRLFLLATSSVMLSTLEDGKVVKGLAGIPSDGPVLFVGYHMLMGHELAPMVSQLLLERNILLRGLAHPLIFMRKKKEGRLPPLSDFDPVRVMGAVPVSGTNLYKLLSSKAHVLLYPGGAREAVHRKGEQYKLFWPEHSEFVRTAARFGAKIVPFGVVGEDDFGEVIFDYDDQMKFPCLREDIRRYTEEEGIKVRAQINGELGNEDMHYPWILPKLPGRFYYYFGKPIETEGRELELRDKDKAQELYLQIKSEVEKNLAFLKDKRESDPYRNVVARLAYQAMHGFTAEVPTFEI